MIGPDALVVDLGAHKGEFSAFVSAEYQCAVLGLEAHPRLYSQLPKFERVRFKNLAIHRDDSDVLFHLSENLEASSIFENVAAASGHQESVAITGTTLDALFDSEKITQVALLKVDIENAEFQMLEAVSERTLSKISQITVEFHVTPSPSEFTSARVWAISRRLRPFGFETYVMDGSYTDVLFLREQGFPFHLRERLAMFVYRKLVMPIRRLIHG